MKKQAQMQIRSSMPNIIKQSVHYTSSKQVLKRLITNFITEYPTHPASKSAYFDLGSYYFDKQEFKQAEKYLKQSVVANPVTNRDVEATYKLAYSYYFQKKYTQARPLFNKIKLGPA